MLRTAAILLMATCVVFLCTTAVLADPPWSDLFLVPPETEPPPVGIEMRPFFVCNYSTGLCYYEEGHPDELCEQFCVQFNNGEYWAACRTLPL